MNVCFVTSAICCKLNNEESWRATHLSEILFQLRKNFSKCSNRLMGKIVTKCTHRSGLENCHWREGGKKALQSYLRQFFSLPWQTTILNKNLVFLPIWSAPLMCGGSSQSTVGVKCCSFHHFPFSNILSSISCNLPQFSISCCLFSAILKAITILKPITARLFHLLQPHYTGLST